MNPTNPRCHAKYLFVMMGAVVVPTCFAADGVADRQAATLVYRCDEGKMIGVVEDAGTPVNPLTIARVRDDPARQGMTMRAVMAASGNKHGDGTHVWWTKGGEGFLAGEDPPSGRGDVLIGGCRRIPAGG